MMRQTGSTRSWVGEYDELAPERLETGSLRVWESEGGHLQAPVRPVPRGALLPRRDQGLLGGGHSEPVAARVDALSAATARRLTDAAVGQDDDSSRIHRAADALLQQRPDGAGMPEQTARFVELETAQLLHALAQAVDGGVELPSELMRHTANLARHLLSRRGSAGPTDPTGSSGGASL